ncbi:MAG: transcriptional repressor, partial [Cyanobacteria bacterium REEB65]|nr:transcriptional repressor [Cyanobacteria bacterium REEB65]
IAWPVRGMASAASCASACVMPGTLGSVPEADKPRMAPRVLLQSAAMQNRTELALAALKERGFRMTRPRRAVLELLDRTEAVLSAHEIKERLEAAGLHIDTVSVYRTLEILEDNGLAHRVLSNGKFKLCLLEPEDHCGLEQSEHCHHNFTCRSCGAVTEFHCTGLEALYQQISRRNGFRIEGHDLELKGLCANCSQGPHQG